MSSVISVPLWVLAAVLLGCGSSAPSKMSNINGEKTRVCHGKTRYLLDCEGFRTKYTGTATSGSAGTSIVGASGSQRDVELIGMSEEVQMFREQAFSLCDRFNTCTLTEAQYNEAMAQLHDSSPKQSQAEKSNKGDYDEAAQSPTKSVTMTSQTPELPKQVIEPTSGSSKKALQRQKSGNESEEEARKASVESEKTVATKEKPIIDTHTQKVIELPTTESTNLSLQHVREKSCQTIQEAVGSWKLSTSNGKVRAEYELTIEPDGCCHSVTCGNKVGRLTGQRAGWKKLRTGEYTSEQGLVDGQVDVVTFSGQQWLHSKAKVKMHNETRTYEFYLRRTGNQLVGAWFWGTASGALQGDSSSWPQLEKRWGVPGLEECFRDGRPASPAFQTCLSEKEM